MANHNSLLVPIGEAARVLGVTIKTVRRWDISGKLFAACRTLGGHRRYPISSLTPFLSRAGDAAKKSPLIHSVASLCQPSPSRAMIYGRVSKRQQKSDLVRQLADLRTRALADGCQVLNTFSDITSGLNDDR